MQPSGSTNYSSNQRVEKNYTDEELTAEIREGKNINSAISFVYRLHSEPVIAFIRSKGGSSHDGEDIFQEAVVGFIKSVRESKYRGEAGIRTFLISIAKNIWYKEIRKRQNLESREKAYEENTDHSEINIEELIGDREVKQHFRDLLNKLDEPCRKVLLLFYYENLSMKEMVDHLPYENEQVVRNKKYKCLQHLISMVTKHPGLENKIKIN